MSKLVSRDLLSLEEQDSYPSVLLVQNEEKNELAAARGVIDFDALLRKSGGNSALSRVKAFLPKLREEQERLDRRIEESGADSVCIEVEESDPAGAQISLSLALCPDSNDSSDSGENSDCDIQSLSAIARIPNPDSTTTNQSPSKGSHLIVEL